MWAPVFFYHFARAALWNGGVESRKTCERTRAQFKSIERLNPQDKVRGFCSHIGFKLVLSLFFGERFRWRCHSFNIGFGIVANQSAWTASHLQDSHKFSRKASDATASLTFGSLNKSQSAEHPPNDGRCLFLFFFLLLPHSAHCWRNGAFSRVNMAAVDTHTHTHTHLRGLFLLPFSLCCRWWPRPIHLRRPARHCRPPGSAAPAGHRFLRIAGILRIRRITSATDALPVSLSRKNKITSRNNSGKVGLVFFFRRNNGTQKGWTRKKLLFFKKMVCTRKNYYYNYFTKGLRASH